MTARRALRRALGWMLGLLVRAWVATLRVTLVVDPALEAIRERPWVIAFWHAHQFALLGWEGRRTTTALVSASLDGEVLAAVLTRLGARVVRGSSTRRGAAGLASVVRAVRKGSGAGFAVDGPRGPARSVRSASGRVGAAVAARLGGGLLVPTAAVASRFVRLTSWDRFEIPLPFSRVVLAFGPPLDPDHTTPDELSRAINQWVDVAGARLESRLALPSEAH